MHLVNLEDDFSRIGDLLHDPVAREGIDEGLKLLSWGGADGTEEIREETLVSVGRGTSFCVDFLEDSHHLGGKEADVVVMTGPESDCVKFLLEVADFDNCLRLADIHHLSKED